MRNSTKIASIAIIIIAFLFWKKKQKDSLIDEGSGGVSDRNTALPSIILTTATNGVSNIANVATNTPIKQEANNSTQVLGGVLPDGTTATGISAILPNPLDVVPTVSAPVETTTTNTSTVVPNTIDAPVQTAEPLKNYYSYVFYANVVDVTEISWINKGDFLARATVTNKQPFNVQCMVEGSGTGNGTWVKGSMCS